MKRMSRTILYFNLLFLFRLSTTLLVGCSLLATARQYIGKHIHCFNSGIVSKEMFEAFCFMSTTYSLPDLAGAQRVSASRGV